MGITERERALLIKALCTSSKKGKEVSGQRGGWVRVLRNLFLASEKSGVCVQWKRKRAWVKGHEAVLSPSFYMIHVSHRELLGLWVGHKTAYMDRADAKSVGINKS